MRKSKIKELFLICYKSEDKHQVKQRDIADNISQVFEQIDVGQIKGSEERAKSVQIRQAAHREVLVSERPIDVS